MDGWMDVCMNGLCQSTDKLFMSFSLLLGKSMDIFKNNYNLNKGVIFNVNCKDFKELN